MKKIVAFVLLASALPARAAPVLSRADFNRLAARAGLPLFWKPVAYDTATLRPEDIAPVADAAALARFVRAGRFTAEFDKAYQALLEERRREAVRKELDQGRPNLILSDLRSSSAADRALARHLVAAGRIIDELYALQKGGLRWRAALAPGDEAGLALFERNHGPWCEAPATEHDPFCNAAPAFPARKSDAYPQNLSQDGAMCDMLKARPDGKSLLDPFTVVREKAGRLVAVPLIEVYGPQMRKVAVELRAAADAQGPDEAALKAYLLGAARGFETGDWADADETWSRMGSRNSRWYLRVAPDEVEFDPCQEKAGFHVSFARIDAASLAWRDKLTPIRQEMEDSLAALIGPSYQARPVAFALPDFIEIMLNSGDSRPPLGATIGQSLPNWGKVALENRRRTVVMTNLYEDPDSKKTARLKAAELLDAEALKNYPADKEAGLVGTILHEAAHNLGPHSDSRVRGRAPAEIFGGRLEGVLEELKAQTGALWYAALLRRKEMLSELQVRRLYTHELAWCFGHIANGMTTDGGAPKPYSQLAAVQIGSFVKAGALEWTAGPDGIERFRVDYERLPLAIEALMKEVGRIKASGDVDGAKALVDGFIGGPGAELARTAKIQERLRPYPKESYSYSVLD
ncbi:MAG TPA: hypothetical protein DCZ01_09235 [Elusimicrobia bacterium]|nr:MAG: hypothetical protein A2X37_09560 [Elusimicrobia bacterium GWA2_66_18]HAZ08683.1 hypothetical protein [Elusimicrobiota bacterium]